VRTRLPLDSAQHLGGTGLRTVGDLVRTVRLNERQRP